MKKLFPLMFALVFANQAFALESEVVVTEVASAEEVTKSVVLDETTQTEVKAVYDELKTRGLTDAQIVDVVEEKLQNETTESAYRSILDKHNQEKVVWALVGAAATCAIIYGAIPGVKWAYGRFFGSRVASVEKETGEAKTKTAEKKADEKPAAASTAPEKVTVTPVETGKAASTETPATPVDAAAGAAPAAPSEAK